MTETDVVSASAPGKIILVGEHAVVYGRPAIAIPVWDVLAHATIAPAAPGAGCTLHAPDLGQVLPLADAPLDNALALVLRLTLAHLSLPPFPDWTVTITSQIPIASGLGSGAALATALVRAVFAKVGKTAQPSVVSDLVFQSETLYHGTPSGIDNTVVAFGQPVWFVKGTPPVTFSPRLRFAVAIADSGISAPTVETVGDVRRSWQADPADFDARFDRIGAIAAQVRGLMEQPGGEVGRWRALGGLFRRNQQLLAEIGVSSASVGAVDRGGAGGGILRGQAERGRTGRQHHRPGGPGQPPAGDRRPHRRRGQAGDPDKRGVKAKNRPRIERIERIKTDFFEKSVKSVFIRPIRGLFFY